MTTPPIRRLLIDLEAPFERRWNGGDAWRRRWMRMVTFFFVTDLLRQMLRNLRHDGALLRWSTWRSAGTFLFGEAGLVRLSWAPWRAYFRADFHPSQQGGERGARWLSDNAAQLAAVGSSS